jgi:hypothetical protein
MKRLANLFLQDLLLAYRSGHVLITGLLLALMLALVVFLPRQFERHNELIYDAVPGAPLAAYLAEQGLGDGLAFTDEAAFRAAVEADPTKVGVVFSGSLAEPRFELITRGAVPAENLGLLSAALDQAVLALRGEMPPQLPVELLRAPAPPTPFNQHIIPIMLVFEVVLLGFLIVAVMMFQEKQEGTLRAYRVTPAGSLAYLASKNALFVVLSLAYGMPILLAGLGLRANYGPVLLLLVLSSSFMTMFSLAVAVFFRNLSEWFFVGVAILIVNSLPMISYGLPSFAPAWLTWVPSYPAVFAVRDALFNAAGLASISPTIAYLAALNVAALAASYAAVRFKLMREGR